MALNTAPNPSAKRMPEPGLFSTPGSTTIVASERQMTSGKIVKSLQDVYRMDKAMRSPTTNSLPASPTASSMNATAARSQRKDRGGLSVETDRGQQSGGGPGSSPRVRASWKPASPSKRSEEAEKDMYARDERGMHYDHGMTEVSQGGRE